MQQEQDLCVALLKRWALGLACVIILRLGDGAPSECDHGPCICQGVDIYNDRDYLEARNCSVVEGRLVIFPSIKLTSFSNKDLEFPFLEDIHDYLTLYGAHDFKFRFPKLVIIRGKRPKHNYALLISKLVNTQVFMPSLQIVRVGIGIHDNRNLCPAKMIDWNAIVSSGETWVYKNTELSSCPTCNSSCPRDPEGNLLCWDGSTCQKILQCPGNCPETAAGCIGKECCDPECIGGCVNNSTRGCLACKNYRHNGDCLKSCPDGLVPYNHRCIVTREECLDVRPTLPRIAQDELIPLTKFFDHSCTRDVCPVGYDTRCSPDKSNRTCQPCPGGRCNTICPGSNEDAVYSVESAMKFGGRCVIIDGSLKIHIRYDVVVEAMMEHMKSIEVITGFLKIYGSFPLTSLDFLPNLKEIRGLERDRFNRTLWIQDNRNLMRLWDWEDRAKRNITGIKINGTIFFHDNHRLCFSEIRKLAEQANLPSEVNDLQVMGIPMYSNGDLGNCYDEELIISPEGIKVFSKVIKLTWFRPQQSPKEDILSYVISYREAPPGQNTSMDDIPCAERSWKYVDIEADQGMNANITQLITQLRPATRYAVYISTLMLNPSKGAVSKMHYITTLPGIPSPPRQVKVLPNGTHALNVAWKSPLHENGVVTSYKIEVIKIQQSLSRRRVCDEMSPKNQEFIKDREAIIKTQKNIITDWNEKDAVEDYDIQSALKDHIGILEDHKCRDEPDQCTSICSTDLGAFEKFHMQTKAALDAVDDEPPPGEISEHVVKGRTEFTVEGLESYAKYLIAVTACQDPFVVDNRTIRNCSPRNGYILGQPLPNVTRDLILDESVMVQVSNDTALKLLDVFWTDPEDPNSDIMGYQYSFKRNESDILEQKHCIHSSDVSQASSTGDPLGRFVQIEMELSPGDYSFQICALSLAKKCEFTDPVYFTLQSHASQQVYIILFVLAGILLLVLIALVYILTRPKEVEVKVDTVICLNPIYNEQNLQLEPDFLDLGDVVGAGNFGVVHKASMARGAFSGNVVDPGLWAEKTQEHPWVKYLLNLRGTKLVLRGLRQVKILGPDKSTLGHDDIPVAVKMLKDWHMASSEQRESFFKEIATMRNMTKTAHVVRLLGVVTIREPAMIIMEWMPLGDLQKWLVKRRSDGRGHVSVEEFYQIAAEIADGMACLHHEDVLHRDLAARNCMLSADLTVKVADFGLARKGNYYKIGNRAHLPIRWCAPEVHQDEWKSTKEGDVWSYGVVLWEIATLGDLPYRDRTVAEVAQMTVEERVLERPDGCPLEIYELMLRCWAPNPDSRPSFKTIVEFFLEVASLSTRFLQESHVNNHRCERCTGSSGATEAPTLTRGPRKWSWWNRHWWAQRLPKVRLKRPQRRRHPLPRVSSPDGDTTDDDKHKQEQTDALLQKNAHQAEEPQTVREDDPDDPLLREKHIV